MNKLLFSACLLLLLALQLEAQKLLPYKAFKRGETLKSRVHYGIIDAGEATVSVAQDAVKFGEKPTFHLVGTGKSAGTFDWFFKVRDRYDSFVDETTLLPQYFMRKVDEGGFIINQEYLFNHPKKNVLVQRNGTDVPRNAVNKLFDIPLFTHDILSAFYFARNADISKVKIGDIINLNSFFDEELFPMQVKIVGREVLKTKMGKIRCIALRPIIQKGRVFKEEEDLTMWVSDDMNRIPVRLQANVLVGSIKMDIKSATNLANPLAIVEK
jgi:hypothetical protein